MTDQPRPPGLASDAVWPPRARPRKRTVIVNRGVTLARVGEPVRTTLPPAAAVDAPKDILVAAPWDRLEDAPAVLTLPPVPNQDTPGDAVVDVPGEAPGDVAQPPAPGAPPAPDTRDVRPTTRAGRAARAMETLKRRQRHRHGGQ